MDIRFRFWIGSYSRPLGPLYLFLLGKLKLVLHGGMPAGGGKLRDMVVCHVNG